MALQFVGKLGEFRGAARYQHKVVAVLREPLGKLVSNAPRGSGDESSGPVLVYSNSWKCHGERPHVVRGVCAPVLLAKGMRSLHRSRCGEYRHRGTGRPASPATPPYMRVRIRRFGGLS